jgi:Flp pilus assembly pilin Flp
MPLCTDERGLETVEYALIAAVLLGAVAAIVPQFSAEFVAAYSAINDAIASALGG